MWERALHGPLPVAPFTGTFQEQARRRHSRLAPNWFSLGLVGIACRAELPELSRVALAVISLGHPMHELCSQVSLHLAASPLELEVPLRNRSINTQVAYRNVRPFVKDLVLHRLSPDKVGTIIIRDIYSKLQISTVCRNRLDVMFISELDASASERAETCLGQNAVRHWPGRGWSAGVVDQGARTRRRHQRRHFHQPPTGRERPRRLLRQGRLCLRRGAAPSR